MAPLAAIAKGGSPAERAALLSDQESLVESAKAETPEQFRRTLATWQRDRSDDDGSSAHQREQRRNNLRLFGGDDGRGVIVGDFDSESFASIKTAINAITEQIFLAEGGEKSKVSDAIIQNSNRQARALVELCRRALGATVEHGRTTRAHVGLVIDFETLLNGLHKHSRCHLNDGTPISPDTARRLACDAAILPIILGGDSVPLDVGRTHRLATAAQRHALRLRYHNECAINDCGVPFDWCSVHHIQPWEHGGATDLTNLVPLCHRHHMAVHEGQWTLRRTTDGTVVAEPPSAPSASEPPSAAAAAEPPSAAAESPSAASEPPSAAAESPSAASASKPPSAASATRPPTGRRRRTNVRPTG